MMNPMTRLDNVEEIAEQKKAPQNPTESLMKQTKYQYLSSHLRWSHSVTLLSVWTVLAAERDCEGHQKEEEGGSMMLLLLLLLLLLLHAWW